MRSHGLVTGGDAEDGGIGVNDDERGRLCSDFMPSRLSLISGDWTSMMPYTLEFLPGRTVLN